MSDTVNILLGIAGIFSAIYTIIKIIDKFNDRLIFCILLFLSSLGICLSEQLTSAESQSAIIFIFFGVSLLSSIALVIWIPRLIIECIKKGTSNNSGNPLLLFIVRVIFMLICFGGIWGIMFLVYRFFILIQS